MVHIYQLTLDSAAGSATEWVAPCDHTAISLQCCKGVFGAVDGLYMYQLALHRPAVSTTSAVAPRNYDPPMCKIDA